MRLASAAHCTIPDRKPEVHEQAGGHISGVAGSPGPDPGSSRTSDHTPVSEATSPQNRDALSLRNFSLPPRLSDRHNPAQAAQHLKLASGSANGIAGPHGLVDVQALAHQP